MLLHALYDYAQRHRLLDDLPVQRRTLHALIDLKADGELRLPYLVRLSQTDEGGREALGMDYALPRFPGENNGGKAYFLAEGSIAVFGRDKKTGEPIPAPGADKKKKDKNPTKAFQYFWDQIQLAYEATGDARLAAMLGFKNSYLTEKNGRIECDLASLRMRPKDKGKKKGELEYVASTGADDANYIAVEKATFGFRVEGHPVTLDDESDPLRQYWFERFPSLAFADDTETTAGDDVPATARQTLCLVTGETGQPIARSHKPRILGVPGIAAGGYIVSFARAAPAFSSYGFSMGENSPVSESAAAAYGLALTALLKDEDQHINLGPVAICSWAKDTPHAGKQFQRLLNKAYPEHVGKFLRGPFAGDVERDILNRDRLYTVALAGNAGRIVVQHWLDQPLREAIDNFRRWWDELKIVSLFADSEKSTKKKRTATTELPPAPLAIPNLARVSLRRSKAQGDDRLVGERIVQLYRAALEGTAPSVMMLKPILDEFHSALVKDDPKKPTFPFGQSRFALIKLILLRNRKEGNFMPTPQLADTSEPAYNLGRLLAVFESVQDRYHDYEKKGAGVVERYYSTASSAPAAVFPLLCRLARHHLSKIRKDDASAANRLDGQIGEILNKFQPDKPGASPHFKRTLTLPQQGTFALGFYQQRAYDRASSLVRSNLRKARDLRNKKQSPDEPLTKARQFAQEFGYADLIAIVNSF
ncbi:MAG: type I-C CRISPR-associated protein Cas8c/Csd1 [Candidatus Paceibacterota bacterium]